MIFNNDGNFKSSVNPVWGGQPSFGGVQPPQQAQQRSSAPSMGKPAQAQNSLSMPNYNTGISAPPPNRPPQFPNQFGIPMPSNGGYPTPPQQQPTHQFGIPMPSNSGYPAPTNSTAPAMGIPGTPRQSYQPAAPATNPFPVSQWG